jgi:uncharacterized protein (DUF433 family)
VPEFINLLLCPELKMENLDRITCETGVMGGKACIRGMRVTVGMILGMLASGHNEDEILADYPYLERADITQAIVFSRQMI